MNKLMNEQAKEISKKITSEDDHVINIGKAIEAMEMDIRNQLDTLYIQKTREIVNKIRKPTQDMPGQAALVGELGAALLRKKR
jgi:hypothetical protein